MKIKYGTILILLFLTGLLSGRCSKGFGPIDTTFTLYAYLIGNQTDTVYPGNWKGYYFFADTADYVLDSYEDALEGLLRLKTNENTTKSPDGEATIPDEVRIEFSHLRQTPAILVVVQPDSMIYAWRPLRLVDGLGEMSTQLTLRTQGDKEEARNGWTIVPKKSWFKIPEFSYRLNAIIQKTEEPEDTETSTAWKGYYYVVDNPDYEVKSLQDAVNRVLSSTVSEDALTEGSKAAENGATKHVLFKGLKEQSVMLVVYEEEYGVFAYRYLDVDKDLEEGLSFRLYRYGSYEEGGWKIVVPEEEEPEPEPEPTPEPEE